MNKIKKKIIGYLVGVEWFSADQGEYTNHTEFPDFFSTSRKEAEKEFKKLHKNNEDWGFGSRRAYIAPVFEGVVGNRRYEL